MSVVVAIGPSAFGAKDDTPRRMLEEAGVTIKENPFGRRLTEEETVDHLAGVDGLLAGLEPLNARVIASAAPRLKAIARVGIGMDNVDLKAAQEHGVKVSNTPDGPTHAVAEMTVAALLALARNLVVANAEIHEGGWNKDVGFSLFGLRCLLVGYGRIGRRTAELLRAFGAEILVSDPLAPQSALSSSEHLVTLEEGLAQADVISLHASGEGCILSSAQFQAMKPGVVLLNSARGALVDEAALVAALESGKVAAVWFDAFWQEPYKGPLTRFKQALLTGHTGTYTRQCRLSMETEAVSNVLRDLGL